jgi:hypothetical protein
MSAARKAVKRPRAAPKRDTTEAAIIGGCVRYLAAIGGASACFNADSTGDSVFAAPVAGKLMGDAGEVLLKFAGKPATTAAAIKAKARVATAIVDTAQHGQPSPTQFAFLRVFMNEVAAFVTPMADAAWRDGKHAKRAKLA